MAVVYFDASALVKLVVHEDGSDLAAQLWDGCDAAVSSRLVYPEVCAALAAAHRNHVLGLREARAAQRSWDHAWASMRPIELSEQVSASAGRLARQHRLRGADAVHLASAHLLAVAGVVVAVWDRRMHAGAVALGMTVAPAQIPTPPV